MKSRVVILTDPDRAHTDVINWERIGEVVTELSHLYQIVRERHIDLILADESRNDLVRSVGVRVRRFNPLTDIWRVVDSNQVGHDEPGYIDGIFSRELGQEGIERKVASILHVKHLLEDYGIVGRSHKMKVVAETIERIAPTEVSVLIVGPSGAGKELVARAIHDNSTRHNHTFVAINCGALAEGVLESELFGHEKGAFTGSVGKREGLFHKADGGTIFLDEISETRGDMQVKLLRVLEDGTYYPVGSSTARKVDVRVVSATNRDLTEAIADRSFREDLYYRIGVVKITLPPLMERKNDIQPLLAHFWRRHPEMDYTDGALDLLMRYDWPGNVRQLRNFADRMVALKGGTGLVETEDIERFIEEQHMVASNLPVSTGRTVEEAGQELIYRAIMQLGNEVRMLRELILAHLPPDAPTEQPASEPYAGDSPRSMEEMEQQLIEKVLEQTGGNRKEAARRLGIGERTLYRKIKKYGLR
ncbi:AAA domain-containing protein [candidate division GN15 bacterium]|nr:AAA domain-containing protein [candidate division GN15 bacterium]